MFPKYKAGPINGDAVSEADLGREKMKAFLGQRVPLKRAAVPDEIARLVGVLFAEEISFLTGETIYVDGGQGIYH